MTVQKLSANSENSIVEYFETYGCFKQSNKALLFDKRDIRQIITDGFIRDPFVVEVLLASSGIILKFVPKVFRELGAFTYSPNRSLHEAWRNIVKKT